MTDIELYPAYRKLVIAIFLRAIRDVRNRTNVSRFDRFTADRFLRSKEAAELLDAFDLDGRLGTWAVEKWGVKWQNQQ